MRKKCNRVTRPIARLLTPKERVDFLIGPRLHLHMLLSQHYALTYSCSLAGIFNLSEILALLLDRHDLHPVFASAEAMVQQLIAESRVPTALEGAMLREAFNLSDKFIGMQNTVTIARAMAYANRELGEGVAEKN